MKCIIVNKHFETEQKKKYYVLPPSGPSASNLFVAIVSISILDIKQKCMSISRIIIIIIVIIPTIIILYHIIGMIV